MTYGTAEAIPTGWCTFADIDAGVPVCRHCPAGKYDPFRLEIDFETDIIRKLPIHGGEYDPSTACKTVQCSLEDDPLDFVAEQARMVCPGDMGSQSSTIDVLNDAIELLASRAATRTEYVARTREMSYAFMFQPGRMTNSALGGSLGALYKAIFPRNWHSSNDPAEFSLGDLAPQLSLGFFLSCTFDWQNLKVSSCVPRCCPLRLILKA